MGSAWSSPAATSSSSSSLSNKATSAGVCKFASTTLATTVPTSISSKLDKTSEGPTKASSTLSASSPSAPTTSPLLDRLPPEIRNIIYRLVLIDDEYAVDVTTDDLYSRTAIVRTCTQIRSEAKDLIFENDFSITCGLGGGVLGRRWLKALGSDIKLIEKLVIRFDTPAWMEDECEKASDLWASEDDLKAYTLMSDCACLLEPDIRKLGKLLHVKIRTGMMSKHALEVRSPKLRRLSETFTRNKFCIAMASCLIGMESEGWEYWIMFNERDLVRGVLDL